MRWMRAVRVCGAALVLAACRIEAHSPDDERIAGPQPPDVVGRWRGERDEVELFAGGRLLLRRGAFRGVGRWERVEPERVLFVYEGALASTPPGDYRVAVTGDTLRLCETDRPARCIRYLRVAPDSPGDPAGPEAAVDSSAADSSAADSSSGGLVEGDDGAPPELARPARPEQLAPAARAVEANGVLKMTYTLQQTYHAMHGRYAETVDQLREVGWAPVAGLRHFRQPEVTTAGERTLCIVMRPRSAELWPVHIDHTGTLGRGDDCP